MKLIMAAACLMAAMTFAAQCAATTAEGGKYCWQHAKAKSEAKPAAKPAPKKPAAKPAAK